MTSWPPRSWAYGQAAQLATFEQALEDPASPMWADPPDEGVEFDPEDHPDG